MTAPPDNNLPKQGGMRVSHPRKRNAMEIITDHTRPFSTPQKVCPVCRVVHTHKTYHILLNEEGVAFVSMGVYRGLRRAGMGNLTAENWVEKPPKLILGTKSGSARRVVERPSTVIVHTDRGE